MLWHPKTLQNLAMYNVFFIFGRFSIAGKLPKWPKIPFQYPLALRHPKILEKCRKHHRILVSVRNRFWGLVSVRNRFWPPPPPAKADIATAILTNVIEHLVLLLPPNKHAFTAKAVWADFVICMNNSRNRSPLRIFQYLPISATFVQCGQRRPSWTMHVNSKISSGALSGMKRLIDEIRSFKCVCVCVMVVWWGWAFCASNSLELESRFMPLWLTGTRAWIGTTHDL